MENLWKAVMAEMFGTMILVFIGCGSCITWDDRYPPSIAQISFTFGLAVAAIAQIIGPISGCHINPAVTTAMCVARKIDPFETFMYILFQCIGAVLGSGLLKVVVPDELEGNLGMTLPNEGLTSFQALFIEFMITIVLVMTVFSVTDPNRSFMRGLAPLAIGFSITACHLSAIRMTGSSMNSARTFGPAFVTKTWEYHWVYWVGPCAGGAVSALLYEGFYGLTTEQKEIINDAIMTTSDPDS